MKTNSIILLFITGFLFFSCRKETTETREYIEIIIEGKKDSDVIVDPEFIIQGNIFMVKHENEMLAEITLPDTILQTGEMKPVAVKLPGAFCEDGGAYACDKNITMFLQAYTKVDEILVARLKGKLWVEDELKEVEVVLNGILDEDFQRICGQLWYDANENNIFDTHENGINGVEVTIETDEGVYESDLTGSQPGNFQVDGYYEFMASTKKPNTIIIHLPAIGLKFVEKNTGNNPEKDSDFDLNGQITGLAVHKGVKLKLDAGVKKK